MLFDVILADELDAFPIPHLKARAPRAGHDTW